MQQELSALEIDPDSLFGEGGSWAR
jgi:hypothetical protein